MPSIYDGTDDTHPKMQGIYKVWHKFLSRQNEAATKRLIEKLGSRLGFVEPRVSEIFFVPIPFPNIPTWHPGSDLPVLTDRYSNPFKDSTEPVLTEFTRPELPSEATLPQPYYIAKTIANQEGPFKNMRPVLDLSAVPALKIGSMLARWFRIAAEK